MERKVHVLRRMGMGRLHERQSRNSNEGRVGKRHGRRMTRKFMGVSRMHVIKMFYGHGEFLTFHSLEKQLGDIFIELLILSRGDGLGLLFPRSTKVTGCYRLDLVTIGPGRPWWFRKFEKGVEQGCSAHVE